MRLKLDDDKTRKASQEGREARFKGLSKQPPYGMQVGEPIALRHFWLGGYNDADIELGGRNDKDN